MRAMGSHSKVRFQGLLSTFSVLTRSNHSRSRTSNLTSEEASMEAHILAMSSSSLPQGSVPRSEPSDLVDQYQTKSFAQVGHPPNIQQIGLGTELTPSPSYCQTKFIHRGILQNNYGHKSLRHHHLSLVQDNRRELLPLTSWRSKGYPERKHIK